MRKLTDLIAPTFYDLYHDVVEHLHTFYWLVGGRGSTKSSFISVMVILLLLQHKDIHVVVLRKYYSSLRESVYGQIQWAIYELGVQQYFIFRTSPLEIIYVPTGQRILFRGADDPSKIKSLKVPFGYVGVVFYEELDQFYGMEEIRNINQSLLRGGSKYWVFCAYNPPRSVESWVNTESLYEEQDRLVTHSTYLTVPRHWLGELFFREAEKLKERNETLYKHEYLGIPTGTGGAVFENVKEMHMSSEKVSSFERIYYGMDFGWFDPFVLICVYYDRKNESLYVFDEIYQSKLPNKKAARLVERKVKNNKRIMADSAEPKSIAEMREYGLNVMGVRKTHDLRDYAYRWLQGLANIYIDRKRCPNAYREFIGYEYATNRQGAFLPDYPDGNDHTLDATRYALFDVIHPELDVKSINASFW